MIDDTARHRDELRALCRRFYVRRLDLFGSAARDDFDPDCSDIDFLVEFDREHSEALSFTTYFGLKETLEALFGRPVDLVEPGAVRNPYLKASIDGSPEPVLDGPEAFGYPDAQGEAGAMQRMMGRVAKPRTAADATLPSRAQMLNFSDVTE